MGNVRRIYVEKKEEYAVKAKELKEEIVSYLQITSVDQVRVLIRYDVENLSDEVFEKACKGIFAEPPVDDLYLEKVDIPAGCQAFSVEFLPGQFDQRADSAMQCVQFLKEDENPIIKTAVTYILGGNFTEDEFERIKSYCINPVDSRETGMEKPETLETKFEEPKDVAIFDGFCSMDETELRKLYDSLGLAMTFKDFLHIQKYFGGEEHRDPSMTEIRVLDTYWSDHCRHTTFSTELTDVSFEEGYYQAPIKATYEKYLSDRTVLYKDRNDKFICLMDLALMGMKKLRAEGKLEDMEVSDEINACSIIVPLEIERNGKKETEEWLIFFKNETHNHPTEIEPFGGAATCLGGAIRDPLSGRGYVYQAMRVTGAADPTRPASETLAGKLSQTRLVRGAAKGYSSYGNQIGLATGYVKEVYHPGYVAKSMEIGAVMGAAHRQNVIRENSDPGDQIILLGGRTGRDGCGGATGSSKAHTDKSIEVCGAEVQKGNAPTERKLQRLFRKAEVAHMIKKCNDFGAGGVSVAIGELAPGLRVDLDKVPKKYAGLDGTELAISESQERMAVVVEKKDVEAFLAEAAKENLEAIVVAEVTKEPRLVLSWRGKEIVNISRAFLDTNGAHQETKVKVEMPTKEGNALVQMALPEVEENLKKKDVKAAFLAELSDLNVCSQKGLVEMFDASIGAGTVVMPYGGKTQLSEVQTMVAKVPVLDGETDAVTMMSYGFDPYVSSWSPYHGAIYAVTESLSKIVAAGGDYSKVRFTFQEYFRRMSEEPERWSQPFAALLGAYEAQIGFGLPSIGGKDSMSGTFNDIDVPPTLVSFAVDVARHQDMITTEAKKAGDVLVHVALPKNEYDLPEFEKVKALYTLLQGQMQEGKVAASFVLDTKGIAAAAAKMSFGNELGVHFLTEDEEAFANHLGDFLLEMTKEDAKALVEKLSAAGFAGKVVAELTEEKAYTFAGGKVSAEEAVSAWKKKLNKVFPYTASKEKTALDDFLYDAKSIAICDHKIGTPTVFIPVFPGTNCEYDSARAFEEAGAKTLTRVFCNQTPEEIKASMKAFEEAVKSAQIVMFPGGFSAGDEPDGSAKFFATTFQNEAIKEAMHDLLDNRDGLALGICNGFQALIKLGLVPNGHITGQDAQAPTLTYNTVNRHISKMVYTKVVSNKSPWLQKAELGKVYVTPASHGEGRFVAPKAWLDKLVENGQVATRYCDPKGNISMDEEYNINGSFLAIEGITSPDGRVLGKMAHVERRGNGVAKNIYGEQDLKIFASGVEYFK